jgi:hypothetical protein
MFPYGHSSSSEGRARAQLMQVPMPQCRLCHTCTKTNDSSLAVMPTALLVSVCLRARLQACINLNSSSSCLTSTEVSGIRRWTDLSHGRQAGGSKTHHHDDAKDSRCHPPALTTPSRLADGILRLPRPGSATVPRTRLKVQRRPASRGLHASAQTLGPVVVEYYTPGPRIWTCGHLTTSSQSKLVF